MSEERRFHFSVEYEVRPEGQLGGHVYDDTILARDWPDAVEQAERMGLLVVGVLIEKVERATGQVRHFDGEDCPPCPVWLRGHPSIKRQR